MENREKLNKIFVLLTIVSFLWFLFSIFFIDVYWWWFLIEVVAISITTYILNKETINNNEKIKQAIRYILVGLTIISIILTIFLVIISAWWWFFLFFDIFMVVVMGSQFPDGEIIAFPKQPKALPISLTILLILLITLFCIPSYVANNHNKPKNVFYSGNNYYNQYNDNDYYLYGKIGTPNLEHVVPQSKEFWNENAHDKKLFNDYHNLYNSFKEANSLHGSYAFGEFSIKDASDGDSNRGWIKKVKNGPTYYMPPKEYRGDVARAVLYMYETYKNDGLDTSKINVSLMKKWAKQDKVSKEEKAHNNYSSEKLGGKRNKFIDTPYLVNFVF
jgi:hypothetical protein